MSGADKSMGLRADVTATSHIDLEADLNWVDDEDRNIARIPEGRDDIVAGAIAVAGRPGAWTWR